MAEKDKKKKKPKHTALVVPDGKKKKASAAKDRLGRSVDTAHSGGAPRLNRTPSTTGRFRPVKPPAGTQAEGGASAKGAARESAAQAGPASAGEAAPKTGGAPAEGLPPNAIVMPPRQTGRRRPASAARKKVLTPKKRKRRRRRIQMLVVLLVVAALVLFYTSGAYVTAATMVGDAWDGLRIMANPGEGWPMELALTGFITARPMEGGGFAALGERDAVMVSVTGAELWRVQHNYMSPGISAGKTRMVVYSRGGSEYTVESRSKTLATGATEQEIQFCELSPDGWLAVATASRYQANLRVYGPAYNAGDVEFRMPLVDERPLLARFASDNRGLLLGCVSASGGALGSTVYLLQTNRSEVQATVRADAAQLLDAQWVDAGRFVAVFDSFTALYNTKGEELARYGHGERSLLALSIHEGRVALAFGASAREVVHTVFLDGELAPQFDLEVEGSPSGTVKVLAASDGAFLLCGQDVYAFTAAGVLSGTRRLEQRPQTLVYGGEPLVLASGLVDSVDGLLHPKVAESSSAPADSDSAPESEDASSSASNSAA